MTVLDVAREQVVSHSADDSVADALDSMRDREVSCVVVVENGHPTGLVTDRSLVLQMGRGPDLEDLTLAEIQQEEAHPVEADTGIYDLIEHMAEATARRVPIVEDGDLVGIISISDVVVLLGMELQLVANVIRTSAPAYERSATDIYD
jgi:CBS domain-containing protein